MQIHVNFAGCGSAPGLLLWLSTTPLPGMFLQPDKPEITNYKLQITNKIKRQLFGILNFGHCNLFDIWNLLFGILFLNSIILQFEEPWSKIIT